MRSEHTAGYLAMRPWRRQLLSALLTLIVVICMAPSLFAVQEALTPQWARLAAGQGQDRGEAIAVDSQGNVVIAGIFDTFADFGETQLESGGGEDIFVAKYDPAGALIWARAFFTAGTVEQIGGLAVDVEGIIYLTGSFEGSAGFDNFLLVTEVGRDVFVAALQPDGNVFWARQAGGGGDDFGQGIAIGAGGSALVSGTFSGPGATFGKMTVTSDNAEGSSFFVARYSADGTEAWVRATGGSALSTAADIAVAPGIGLIAVGSFSGTLTYGARTGQTAITSRGGTDAVLLALTANGDFVGLQQGGGPLDDAATAVVAGPKGEAVIAGTFLGTALFDKTELTATGPLSDIFLASYDPFAALIGAVAHGGPGVESPMDLEMDGTGLTYLGGYFAGDMTLGPAGFSSENGSPDPFLAAFPTISAPSWAYHAPGPQTDGALGIAPDDGIVYMTGFASRGLFSANFDLPFSGGTDALVAALKPEEAQLPDIVPTYVLMDVVTGGVVTALQFEETAQLDVSFGALNAGAGAFQGAEPAPRVQGDLLYSDDPLTLFSDSHAFGPLTPGASDLSLPRRIAFPFPGEYAIGLTADIDAIISEADESNNVLQQTITVVPRPVPLMLRDDFRSGDANQWQPSDVELWTVDAATADPAYCITTSDYAGGGNGTLPGARALLTPGQFGNFAFTASFRFTDLDEGNPDADVALIFAWQDDANFAYVTLGRATGSIAVIVVRAGEPTQIGAGDGALPDDQALHTLKLRRERANVQLFFDGRPVLESEEKSLLLGLLGIGSIDDAPCFDNVVVSSDPDFNAPPVATRTPAAIAITVGDQPAVLDLNQQPPLFLDPDGDALTLSARIDDPAVAALDLVDGVLSIMPLAAGNTDIRLMAADNAQNTIEIALPLTVTTRPLPDLMSVLELRDTNGTLLDVEQTLQAGDTLEIVYGMSNAGPGAFPAPGLSPVVSLELVHVETASALMSGSMAFSEIAPAEQQLAAPLMFVIPWAGTYRAQVVSDVTGILPEADEDNNVLTTLVAARRPEEMVEVMDGFDGGAGDWLPLTPDRWDVGAAGGNAFYCINTTELPASSAPGEYSLLQTVSLAEYVISCTIRMTAADATNPDADAAILFGFQNASNYYFSLFSREPGVSGIYKVVDGAVQPLTRLEAALPLDSSSRPAKIVRSQNRIDVLYEGRPVFSALDAAFQFGSVGVGTLNDAPCFDAFRVAGDVLSNSPPVVIGTLPDIDLVLGQADTVIDLGAGPPLFADADNPALSLTAVAEQPAVLEATITDGQLLLSARGVGETRINLTATDVIGAAAVLQFLARVTETVVDPLVIEPAMPAAAGSGVEVNIPLQVSGPLVPGSLKISYRRGGDPGFITEDVNGTEAGFVANVPAAFATSRGIEYFFTADAVTGLSLRLPASGIFDLQIRTEGELSTRVLPSGLERTGYRLFSVPFILDDPTVDAVLADDLGTYNRRLWRFFELAADQSYTEYPDAFSLAPGRAYWLVVRTEAPELDTGAGLSLATGAPLRIPLAPGWNFVGNPFHFTIPVANVRLESGATLDLREYEGVWLESAATEMTPFAGYALFVTTAEGDALVIDPDLTASETRKTAYERHSPQWSIGVRATSGAVRDEDTRFGIDPAAQQNMDRFDRFEPPVIGDYISLAFENTALPSFATDLARDIRSAGDSVRTWHLVAKTNVRGKVSLEFEDLDALPDNWEAALIDPGSGIAHDLRGSHQVSWASAGTGQPRRLRIVAGPRRLVDEQLDALTRAPGAFALLQNYPNPFNPATTIAFDVAAQGPVTVTVFDVAGRLVDTLLDGTDMAAGRHTVVWEGRRGDGTRAASGMYFIRMRAGGFSAVRKIVLVE